MFPNEPQAWGVHSNFQKAVVREDGLLLIKKG